MLVESSSTVIVAPFEMLYMLRNIPYLLFSFLRKVSSPPSSPWLLLPTPHKLVFSLVLHCTSLYALPARQGQ